MSALRPTRQPHRRDGHARLAAAVVGLVLDGLSGHYTDSRYECPAISTATRPWALRDGVSNAAQTAYSDGSPGARGIGGEWPVELDETWVGGATQGEGRGRHHKTVVIGAVEVRPRAMAPGPDPNLPTGQASTQHKGGHGRRVIAGRLRLQVVPGRSQRELEPFVIAAVIPHSVVRTDGWIGYDNLATLGYRHHPVATQGDPAKTEAHLPMLHIVFGNLDAGLLGCHHGVSPTHLQTYLNAFEFRFNRRFWPMVAFDSVLKSAVRVEAPTYRGLYNNAHCDPHPAKPDQPVPTG